MSSINARILGTGSYLPSGLLTNADLEKRIDTTDEWIVERTGIRQRHVAAQDQFSSDLAVEAAKLALLSANLTANDIELIVLATTTPDRVFPSTACLVQGKLGITNGCPAMDVQAVCSGFIYALSTANAFIRSGQVKTALVIGAETLTRITDYTDRGNCMLWGDGAGAVVLGASSEEGIISTHLHADGRHEEMLFVEGGGTRGIGEVAYMRMQGNGVFKMAVNTLDAIVEETLVANGLQKSDLDWLVPHQANKRIIDATARKLDMSMERVILTVGEHGNTSAASVPLALDAGVKDGRIKRGELILMEAFGGGFTWGSALVRF
jgi:3-oxoacyl-[acyl-carrier-protein] synthase-3